MELNNKTRENDLPLMANLDSYHVQHYVLDLTCHFSKNILSGSITLFVNRVNSDSRKSYIKNDILQTQKRKQLITDQNIIEKKQKNCNKVSKYTTKSHSSKLTDSLDSYNEYLDEKQSSSVVESGQYLKVYSETDSSIVTHHNIRSSDGRMSYIPKLDAIESSHSNLSCSEEEILPAIISSNDKSIKEIIPAVASQENIMNEKDITEESAESVNSFTKCLPEKEQFTNILEKSDLKFQSVRDNQCKQFVFILDACDIIVSEVILLHIPWCERCQNKCFKECETGADSSAKREEFYHQCSLKTGKAMSFKNDKWSLRIFENEPTDEFCINSKIAIKIKYSTHAKGKSLKWVPDQDGNMCMFTCGHWINNRSLFPSQDHSEALSTWQASIIVEHIYTVIMTGDKQPLVTNTENGKLCYFYQSTMLLPSSTLAIAVGQWEHSTITCLPSSCQDSQQKWIPEFCAAMHGSCSVNYSNTTVSCRVFSPRSLVSKAESEFNSYLPKCLTKACNILGPYPFCRLDILITPSCFDCLGLTSPCIIFLSQSVLVGDGSFCNCLAHEICHSWFGLLIGPKDWTEEWMSEGFASFVEDIIHTDLIGLDELFELRAYLKYRLLTAELEHTDTSLQIMRTEKNDRGRDWSVLPYIKEFLTFFKTNVNKGYFLLRYLAQNVGMEPFQDLLRVYVSKYHGQLVSSQDFLKLLFDVFPNLSEEGLSPTQICTEWLDRAGLPVPLLNYKIPTELSLINDVCNQVRIIEKHCVQKNSKSLQDSTNILNFKPVCQDQIVLFLELLLDVAVPKNFLNNIREKFAICHANPDIQHRWCELVIKNKYAKFYGDIKHFLLYHQAMSTYLYGEMVLSGTRKQISIAKECFKELLPHMEEDLKETLHNMIFG